MVYIDDVIKMKQKEDILKKVALLLTAFMALTCLSCCSAKKSKTETKNTSVPEKEAVISEAKTDTQIIIQHKFINLVTWNVIYNLVRDTRLNLHQSL